MISAPIWNLGVAVDWVGGRAGLDGRQVVVEVGSVLDRKFSKLRRNLSTRMRRSLLWSIVTGWPVRVEHLQTVSSAHRRIVVADPGERTDDLVRDMIEAFTSICAWLYGRRGARNRAMRALTTIKHGPGEAQ